MPFIETISPADAEGELKRLYEEAVQRAGYVANIIAMMSRDARVVRSSMQFYLHLMKTPNGLAPARREMIATVVSNVNDCYY